ncbi:MAG: AMP phosphorylase [Candidatus Diapherotrites archaeon]|nr:AMP phosphorylase [Candidatus Diapherotrites archaeon]
MKSKDGYVFRFTMRPLPIKAGKMVCHLNEADAKEMGIQPFERIELTYPRNKKKAVSVVDLSYDSVLKRHEIGVLMDVQEKLGIRDGSPLVEVRPVGRPESIDFVKKKMNNQKLSLEEIKSIVEDISSNHLSEIETAAFVSAVYINGLDLDESTHMTKALIGSGKKLSIPGKIVDKHSIGGLNGRATMIVVPIVASTGLKIPKTSSRSITSAAGTADAMEVLAPVNLSLAKIREITQKTGGVIAWGGAVDLAPADDKIIKIEYPLSLDPEGQVIASVMAKKASVGAQYVVIDLPVGPDVKVKTQEKAESLARKFIEVGKRIGIRVEAVITNGMEPSGPAFGAALEAQHVLKILEGKVYDNLAQKAVELSGVLLELAGKSPKGKGTDMALHILQSGKALSKMKEIIRAQGGKPVSAHQIPFAKFRKEVRSMQSGELSNLNVKALTTIARMAGAPIDPYAGILLHVEEGQKLRKEQPVFTIYSGSRQRLDAAYDYMKTQTIIEMEKIILEKLE